MNRVNRGRSKYRDVPKVGRRRLPSRLPRERARGCWTRKRPKGFSIRQAKANARAVHDAKALEAACAAINLTRKLRVGQLTAEKIERIVIGKRAGGLFQ